MKVAVGWSGPVPATQSSAAMRDFFTTLLSGGTLDQAKAAADATVSGGFNPTGAQLVVKTKSWVQNSGNMTLAQLMAAQKPPTDD